MSVEEHLQGKDRVLADLEARVASYCDEVAYSETPMTMTMPVVRWSSRPADYGNVSGRWSDARANMQTLSRVYCDIQMAEVAARFDSTENENITS